MSNPAARASAHGLARAIGRMDPPEPLEFGVAERLHAEADAVDAGVAEPLPSGQASTVSGLVSSVISASRLTSKRLAARRDQAADSAGSSSDGVPPPKKIVSARSAAAALAAES